MIKLKNKCIKNLKAEKYGVLWWNKRIFGYAEEKNGEATANTYRSKIYAFYEFFSLELREMDVTYICFLNVMDKDTLLRSIEYYVKAGNLKSRAAVDIYF